jgi:FAD-linked sulfhydryl oxidase
MGLEPNMFGPVLWGAIHFIALGAPASLSAEDQIAYKAFYYQLPKVIPCASCAQHFTQTLNDHPIDDALTGSNELFAWTVMIHNVVNARLGKKHMSVSDARIFWMNTKTHTDSNDFINSINGVKKYTNYMIPLATLLVGICIGSMLYMSYTSSPFRMGRTLKRH